MGMFDDIIIEEDLVELGIPKGNYQTKDLNCGLDTYTIDKDGNIILKNMLDVDIGRYWEEGEQPLKLPSKMINVEFHLNMYGDKIYYKGELRNWLGFILTIKDGKVVKVEETSCYPADYIEVDMSKITWVPIEDTDNDPKCEGCGRIIDTTSADVTQSWNSPTGIFLKGYCPNCETKFMVTERTSVDKTKNQAC